MVMSIDWLQSWKSDSTYKDNNTNVSIVCDII